MKMQTLQAIFRLNTKKDKHGVRGGGWFAGSGGVRVDHRTTAFLHKYDPSMGFRLVQERWVSKI